MEKKELYRIKKGEITSSKTTISFDFGIIFEVDGIFSFDLYINESYDLSEFIDNKNTKKWDLVYSLKCLTEENNELEVDGLAFTNITPHYSKVKMVCHGKIRHTKIKSFHTEYSEIEHNIHYIELEGLKMSFCDITEEIKARGGEKIKNGGENFKIDHTSALLVSKKVPYSQIFYKAEYSENIIVEFLNESNQNLTYKRFCEIKSNYISILSLINGAEVRIRKECTGSYYTNGKIDSEIVILNSFRKINNDRYNSYLPISGNSFSRAQNIINTFFISSFDKFQDWNDKIDLNTIIFYLANSEQSKSIKEKFFIQMIAFERLTSMYAELSGIKEEFVPNKNDYAPIKIELFEILEKHKAKFEPSYDIIKSKIGNLNQIKRLSTTDKMFRIINDVKIPISKEIENLINVARNNTIHNGDIEEGREGIVNFYLLDELIREIILRLIEYKGFRNSRILLTK